MKGKGLDLLLVNPGARRQIYQALGATLSAVETPVFRATPPAPLVANLDHEMPGWVLS